MFIQRRSSGLVLTMFTQHNCLLMNSNHTHTETVAWEFDYNVNLLIASIFSQFLYDFIEIIQVSFI